MNRRSKGRLRQWLFERFRKRASPEDISKIDKRLNSMKRGPIKKRWSKVQALWEFASSARAPWAKKTIAKNNPNPFQERRGHRRRTTLSTSHVNGTTVR